MSQILVRVNELKNQPIREVISNRMSEFESFQNKLDNQEEIFRELCFCLLTANYSAEGGIKIQKSIGHGFIDLNQDELAKKLIELGHRFPNARAKFIVEARKHIDNLPVILQSLSGNELREWFVENVKGLGFKESSHFLRNIGFGDYAIVDFHIIDILAEHELIEKIERGKGISKKKYLEIEGVLKQLGQALQINMAELDLYLWYLETGKVLK